MKTIDPKAAPAAPVAPNTQSAEGASVAPPTPEQIEAAIIEARKTIDDEVEVARLAALDAIEAAEREAAERIADIKATVEHAQRAAGEAIAAVPTAPVALSSKLIVGCKLPNGIVLEHPLDPNHKVALNGLNRSLIVGAPYATTEVDRDFWDQWLLINKDFGPLKVGAIFAANSERDVRIIANEVSKVRVGFEQMPQDALGVKKADDKLE